MQDKEEGKQIFVAYLEEDLSKETVISDMENAARKGIKHLHRTVDIWDDILGDLSEDERLQIADNMKTLHHEFKQKCSPEFNKDNDKKMRRK